MQELEAAAVVLLLVSHDFIASDFCWSTELEVAMHRHKRGECIIIPIILRPCDWQHPPLGTLQVLPKDGKPITTWSNVDEAWLDVAHGIRSAIAGIAPATPSRSSSSS